MSMRGQKNFKPKPKKVNNPKKSVEDAVEEPVKDAVEEPVEEPVKDACKDACKDAGDDADKESGDNAVEESVKDADKESGDDADKESGDDADKESSDDADDDQPLIIAAKTKQDLVGKNSVSSDAEEYFKNVAKTRDLKLKRKVHKAVLYNVGGAQHFLNDSMDRTHDRWMTMVRIAPRSLLKDMCMDLGEITKHRPLHNLMAKHSNTYLEYLMREGLSSAEDLRRLYAGKEPSCGNLKDLAKKKAQQEKQDESAPLVFTTHAKVKVLGSAAPPKVTP